MQRVNSVAYHVHAFQVAHRVLAVQAWCAEVQRQQQHGGLRAVAARPRERAPPQLWVLHLQVNKQLIAAQVLHHALAHRVDQLRGAKARGYDTHACSCQLRTTLAWSPSLLPTMPTYTWLTSAPGRCGQAPSGTQVSSK